MPDIFQRVRQDPSALDVRTPREFELLVAELLASFGWEVSLTPSYRDGGYDILAIVKDASGFETTWIVECKRFSRDRRIQVGAIQRRRRARRIVVACPKHPRA
jgi:HJR/Mrr/RecB family endonuclease